MITISNEITLAKAIRFMHSNIATLNHEDMKSTVIPRYLSMVSLALASFCDQRQILTKQDLLRANDYTKQHLNQHYQKKLLDEFYQINHFAIDDYFHTHQRGL